VGSLYTGFSLTLKGPDLLLNSAPRASSSPHQNDPGLSIRSPTSESHSRALCIFCHTTDFLSSVFLLVELAFGTVEDYSVFLKAVRRKLSPDPPCNRSSDVSNAPAVLFYTSLLTASRSTTLYRVSIFSFFFSAIPFSFDFNGIGRDRSLPSNNPRLVPFRLFLPRGGDNRSIPPETLPFPPFKQPCQRNR